MFTRCWLPPESRPTSSPARSREVGLLEHPRDRRLDVRHLLQPREQAQVLRHRELRVERGLLRDPADLLGRQRDGARARRQRAGEDLQQRRLAGAVGPDDRDAARRGAAANDTSRSARALAVALAHPVRAQGGVGHRRHRPEATAGAEAAADAASSASPSSVPHAGQRVGAGPARGAALRAAARLGGAGPAWRRLRRWSAANEARAGATAGRSQRLEAHVAAQVDDASRAGSRRSAAR